MWQQVYLMVSLLLLKQSKRNPCYLWSWISGSQRSANCKLASALNYYALLVYQEIRSLSWLVLLNGVTSLHIHVPLVATLTWPPHLHVTKVRLYIPVVECDVAVVETVRLSHLNAVEEMTDLIDVRSACTRLAKRTARVTYVRAYQWHTYGVQIYTFDIYVRLLQGKFHTKVCW